MSYRGKLRGNGPRREPNGFDNPTFSASVRMQKSDWEIQIQRKLQEFAQATTESSLILPAMDSQARKRVHELANRYGLLSHSEGREPNRAVVLTQKKKIKTIQLNSLTVETTPILLTDSMHQKIHELMETYNLTEHDVSNHLSVRAAKKATRARSNQGYPQQRMQLLVPPKCYSTPAIQEQRKKLPAFAMRRPLIDAINRNKVVLVTGGTGCGKTTQIPQFLLEESYASNQPIRIICTQPRRLPAIAVADRVSKERGEQLGSTVGYHIRLEQKTSPSTILTYCTSGVLLRMLTQDDVVKNLSHIILDEIHEREQNTDSLLIALKQAIAKERDLKIVMMSATMEGNLDMFKQYFGDVPVQHIDIPSRLFNVEKLYLGDIIALTGFQPSESIFTGAQFGSSNPLASQSFPQMSQWRSEQDEQQQQQQAMHSMAMAGMPTTMGHPHKTAANFQYMAQQQQQQIPPQGMYSQPPPAIPHPTQPPPAPQPPVVQSQSQQPQQQATPRTSASTLFDAVAQQLATFKSSGASSKLSGSQPQQQSQSQQPPPPPPPQQQQQQRGVVYEPYGYQDQAYHPNGSHQQGGMIHAATWAAGMDQCGSDYYQQQQQQQQTTSYHHQQKPQQKMPPPPQRAQAGPSQQQSNPEVIEHQSTSEDFRAIKEAFGNVIPEQSQQPPPPVPQVHQQQQSMYSKPPPNWKPYDQQVQGDQMQYFCHPMNGTVSYPARTMGGGSMSMMHMQAAGVQQGQGQANAGMSFKQIAQASTFGSFGAALNEERQQMEQMRLALQNCLRDRAPSFSREALDHMRRNIQMPPEQLADFYLQVGGHQYNDNVDVDLVIAVARYIMDCPVDGAILVFLPGCDDITDVKDKLIMACAHTRRKPEIFTLHSQMNTADQHRVFDHLSQDRRKVILSTNIAEASLTIDDVVFVIDTGKVKEKNYDHDTRISQLKTGWIAKSNAEQRSGRAGRCQEGFCFRLYSQTQYSQMAMTQKAEMQRAAIHEVCLHAKIVAPDNMTVREFLSMAPEPPPLGAIDHSMAFLEQLGALYSEYSTSDVDVSLRLPYAPKEKEAEMTDLGMIIAKLPLDPQLARMLLFGLALKVLTPVVTLVAALSHRDPFIIPMPDDRERCNFTREHFAGTDFSDHLALLRAINEFEQCRTGQQTDFCRRNFLSKPAMQMILGIRRQLLGELRRAHLIQDVQTALGDPEYNRYSDRWPMVQAAIGAGCYPGIGFTKTGSKLRKIKTNYQNPGTLHPSSVIKRQVAHLAKRDVQMTNCIEYLAFQELAKLEEGLTLKTVTVIPPVATILSIGGIRLKQSVIKEFNLICDNEKLEVEKEAMAQDGDHGMVQTEFGGVPAYPVHIIEEWLACKGSYNSMRDLLRLRFKLMSYFLDAISQPAILHQNIQKYDHLLNVVADVLEEDHHRVGFRAVPGNEVYAKERYAASFQYHRQYNSGAEQYQQQQQHATQGSRGNQSQPYQQQPQPQYYQQQANGNGYSSYSRKDDFKVTAGYCTAEITPSQPQQQQQQRPSDDVRDYQKQRATGFNQTATAAEPFYYNTPPPPPGPQQQQQPSPNQQQQQTTQPPSPPQEDLPPPDPVPNTRQPDVQKRDYNKGYGRGGYQGRGGGRGGKPYRDSRRGPPLAAQPSHQPQQQQHLQSQDEGRGGGEEKERLPEQRREEQQTAPPPDRQHHGSGGGHRGQSQPRRGGVDRRGQDNRPRYEDSQAGPSQSSAHHHHSDANERRGGYKSKYSGGGHYQQQNNKYQQQQQQREDDADGGGAPMRGRRHHHPQQQQHQQEHGEHAADRQTGGENGHQEERRGGGGEKRGFNKGYHNKSSRHFRTFENSNLKGSRASGPPAAASTGGDRPSNGASSSRQ